MHNRADNLFAIAAHQVATEKLSFKDALAIVIQDLTDIQNLGHINFDAGSIILDTRGGKLVSAHIPTTLGEIHMSDSFAFLVPRSGGNTVTLYTDRYAQGSLAADVVLGLCRMAIKGMPIMSDRLSL